MNKIKKLSVAILMAFVLIVMMPSQIFAAPTAGLLRGVASDSGVTALTDGDDTTGVSMSAGQSITFTLSSPKTLKAWYAVGQSGISMQYRDSTNTPMLDAGTTGASSSFTNHGPYNDVKYVVMKNNSGTTMIAYEVDVLEESPPDITPPPVPTGLSGNTGDSQVSLNWNANATDTAGYNVYMDGTKLNTSLITGTTYTKTGLTNGTAYTFEVSAVDAAGNESAKSSPVTKTPAPPPDTTPPAVPTGLTGIAGDQQVQLSWTANTDDATGYNVYQDGVKVNTAVVSDTSYTVTGLTNGINYTFEITAVDAAGNESAKSAAITKKPFETLNVNLIPNGTSIIVQVDGGSAPFTVTWDSQSDTFSATTYVIEGLSKATDYTVTVTDDEGSTFTALINTGTLVGFVPPVMPNPQGIFQEMLDAFGVSGDIGLAIILGAVTLGILCILGLFGWRLTKKWLSSAK